MQVLDRAGVGTLWSICKVKFALAGHTHSSITDGTMTIYSERNNEVNFGGSKKTDTICFGYRAKDSKPIPSNFVFGSDTGTATLIAAKFKGALEGNASTASNASRVNGHTVNSDVPSGAKFTDTNTWRGIQDNLTSTSTSESLSANQGRVLKGLVDGKANSSHTHSWPQISGAPATATRWPSWVEVTGKPDLKNWSETKSYIDSKAASLGGVEQILNTTAISLQDQFTDTGVSDRYTVGKFNSYKYIDRFTDGEKHHVVNIDYNFVLVGNKESWPIEPDLPSFIISDNVEQVGEYKPRLDKYSWITKLYKIKDFNKTIYLDRSTYLYYKITEDGMKQCDSNGNILV